MYIYIRVAGYVNGLGKYEWSWKRIVSIRMRMT